MPNIIILFKKPKKYDISILERNPRPFLKKLFKFLYGREEKDKEYMIEKILKCNKRIEIFCGNLNFISKNLIDLILKLSENKNLTFIFYLDPKEIYILKEKKFF